MNRYRLRLQQPPREAEILLAEQKVLDPRESGASGTWTPPGQLPPWVRQFGRFPNIDSWQPGDLLLVSATRPPFASRAVISAQQSGGYRTEDARWHHAAVYIGGRIGLCEATLRGVGSGPIYPYIGKHLLRVRRDPALSREEGWEIAVSALTRLRSSYSFGSIVRHTLQAGSGFWKPSSHAHYSRTRSVICSQLYADAYSMVTGKVLFNPANGEVSPAFLSSTGNLVDVDLCWQTIGS